MPNIQRIQGFIYISSVIQGNHDDNDVPSFRSGLSNMHEQANQSSHLLVVSRISNQKVLPWMVSTTGAIRCFDTVSLSQKLSLHRHTRVPIMMHVFLWDRNANFANVGSIRARAMSTCTHSSPNETRLANESNDDDRAVTGPPPLEDNEEGDDHLGGDGAEIKLERDTAGEFSFRFREFAVKNNWL